MTRFAGVLVFLLSGCAPSAVERVTSGNPGSSGTEPQPQDTPALIAPAVAPTPFCAVAHLGVDLRALPRGTSARGIDIFVLGQADDVRAIASEPPLRVAHLPGTGVLYLYFDAATPEDALERCERSVTEYLASAPQLPRTMEPAARLTDSCRACDATSLRAP